MRALSHCLLLCCLRDVLTLYLQPLAREFKNFELSGEHLIIGQSCKLLFGARDTISQSTSTRTGSYERQLSLRCLTKFTVHRLEPYMPRAARWSSPHRLSTVWVMLFFRWSFPLHAKCFPSSLSCQLLGNDFPFWGGPRRVDFPTKKRAPFWLRGGQWFTVMTPQSLAGSSSLTWFTLSS